MERLFMGCQQIRLDSVDSTNNYTATLISGNSPEGTVVITREQTAGRGQRANSWVSEAGKNLTCTYLLRPKFLRISDQFILNKAIALATAKAIQQFVINYEVRIKWPNDIFLQNKKVAGILLETSLQGGHIVSCLAGIGINVNQQQFQAESGNPISLSEVLETELKLDDVLNKLSENMEVLYLQLKAGKFQNIDSSYNSLLWKKDEKHTFYSDGISFTAEVKYVDEQGCLHLLDEENQELIFAHGAVQWF
jgi:BirA family biotin operon repressor/biotin-[acetyl-CoA-carboxylase] ligase